MQSTAGRSRPSAMAGKPSVTKFIHKICMGSRGSGRPARAAQSMVSTSPTLQPSR